jgi:hypothetical protein
MKLKLNLIIFFTFFSVNSYSIFYFRNIPNAKTVAQSKAFLSERKNQLISFYANKKIGESFQITNHRNFTQTAVAKAYLNRDAKEVSRIILQDKFKPFGKVGTNYKLIPKLCERKGDYDFALIHLVQLAFISNETNFLSRRAYEKLLFELLTAKGDNHHRRFSLGICGIYQDTENHILMTETSRYLTNDLIKNYYKKNKIPLPKKYDNNKNGFNTWMMKHLDEFKGSFFDEYNSKPYQSYALLPIANLVAFATNIDVVSSAQELLDYQTDLFKAQSINGRRIVPFRRQIRYEQEKSLIPGDGEIARHALLTGQIDFYPGTREYRLIGYGAHIMFSYAITGIKLSDKHLKELIYRNNIPTYQIFNHQTPEIYYHSKSYLLSAGGVHVNRIDGATKLNDGWAMPTTLMTKKNNTFQIDEIFRFKGNRHRLKRKNTCVYKNFACGQNFSFPKGFKESCGVTKGGFMFFDLSTNQCGNHGDVLLVLKTSKCDTFRCKRRALNVGFFEVREKNEITLTELIQSTLSSNNIDKIKSTKKNTYITSLGDIIEFSPMTLKKRFWEISKINGKAQMRNFDMWSSYFFKND